MMLRHGQTEYNAGGRMQGQLDTPLSDLGIAQAVAAAEVLAIRQPLTIISSDLSRALDTAVELAGRSDLQVRLDERLRETHLGDWQGRTHQEVDSAGTQGAAGLARGCQAGAAWRQPDRRRRRSRPLVAELVAGEPEWGADDCERPVVLVAHGGLIAALTACLLDLPVNNWPALGGMGNASWTQLSGHGPAEAALEDLRWRLDVWNASAQVSNDVL